MVFVNIGNNVAGSLRAQIVTLRVDNVRIVPTDSPSSCELELFFLIYIPTECITSSIINKNIEGNSI